MSPIRIVGAFAAVVLAAGCAGPARVDGPQASRFVTIVDAAKREIAPQIAGPGVDGRALSTSDYAGKVLVINLWGPWCQPSRAEAPVLRAVSDEYATRDVQFLGIVNDASDDSSAAFNVKAGITYPHFSDQGGALEVAFNDSLPAAVVPTTWVIDREGRVAARIVDSDLAESTLTRVLDDILAESPAA
jgi:thiol-disulfide isomerase/thioredoxin